MKRIHISKVAVILGADPTAKDVGGQTAFARVDGTDQRAEINLLKTAVKSR